MSGTREDALAMEATSARSVSNSNKPKGHPAKQVGHHDAVSHLFFRYGSGAPASASIDAHSHLFKVVVLTRVLITHERVLLLQH